MRDLNKNDEQPYPGRTLDIVICIIGTVVALWACIAFAPGG